MSVYEGNRDDSALKFKWNAQELVDEIFKFLTTKQIPKAWRFLVSTHTAETARSIEYNIGRAERFSPTTSAGVLKRKEFYTLAIADCDQVLRDIRRMKAMGASLNKNTVEKLEAMAEEEIKLLSGVRKATKLRGVPDITQKIADAEAELERLRCLE